MQMTIWSEHSKPYETIVQTATVKGAEDILRVTGAVNNDLVAAEAIYHKACHATYIRKNNLHYEGTHPGGKKHLMT